MKVRVILNPSAGRQILQKQVERIMNRLLTEKTVRQVDLIRTTGKGDAYTAAREILPWEVDLVLSVGGDGTVNEIVNGLIAGQHSTPLAILPAGTVNDFATHMRLPRDIDGFCGMVRRFRTVPVDAGKAGSDYFLNVAAGGLLTDVAYKVPSEAKTALGQLAYLISGAIDLPNQLYKSIPVKIKSDQQLFEDEILLFIVANSASVGGFRNLAPLASVQDGLLDVMIIHRQGVFELLPLLAQMVNGDHLKNQRVTFFQASRLEVSCLDNTRVQLDVDGEPGDFLPLDITVKPGAVNLLVP